MERIGAHIQEEIAGMILRGDIRDPRVSSFLTVNRVEVTADLAFARVYVSSFQGDKKSAAGVDGLNSAAGFVRTVMSKKMHLRTFPKLTFILDTSIREGMDMLKKLDALAAARPAESTESGKIRSPALRAEDAGALPFPGEDR